MLVWWISSVCLFLFTSEQIVYNKTKNKKNKKHHRLATQKAVTGGSVEANASMTSHHLTHLPGVELPVVESTCIIVIIRLIPPSSQVFIRSEQTGRSCHPRLTEPGMNVTVSSWHRDSLVGKYHPVLAVSPWLCPLVTVTYLTPFSSACRPLSLRRWAAATVACFGPRWPTSWPCYCHWDTGLSSANLEAKSVRGSLLSAIAAMSLPVNICTKVSSRRCTTRRVCPGERTQI